MDDRVRLTGQYSIDEILGIETPPDEQEKYYVIRFFSGEVAVSGPHYDYDEAKLHLLYGDPLCAGWEIREIIVKQVGEEFKSESGTD